MPKTETTETPQSTLSPKQLKWCRKKLRSFTIVEKQSAAALEDTRRYHDKYFIHERGTA